MLSRDRAIDALQPRIGKGASVVTDAAAAYPPAMKTLGVTLTQTDAKKHAINKVNTLHSNLAAFMASFRGVSTKHLQSYLHWFEWLREFKTEGSNITDVMTRQLVDGYYRSTTRDYMNIRSPYLDYWGM